jgi:hypothetical protein
VQGLGYRCQGAEGVVQRGCRGWGERVLDSEVLGGQKVRAEGEGEFIKNLNTDTRWR